MLQLLREHYSFIYPPLSIAEYSFIQSSELLQWNHWAYNAIYTGNCSVRLVEPIRLVVPFQTSVFAYCHCEIATLLDPLIGAVVGVPERMFAPSWSTPVRSRFGMLILVHSFMLSKPIVRFCFPFEPMIRSITFSGWLMRLLVLNFCIAWGFPS